MPPKPATMTSLQADAYGVSAGLDAVAGVMDLIAGQEYQQAANYRADMIRRAAQADAQRYSEQAEAHIAQMGVMYTASGVTLAGSPIAALDKQKQLADENAAAIIEKGAIDASDEQSMGSEAAMRGRNALVGGLARGTAMLNRGFGAPAGAPPGTGLGGTP